MNQVTITPVRDEAGEVTHFVGVQTNAGAAVLADQQRDEGRAAANRAEQRLHASEHSLALGLQRSLLPVLPAVAGLQLAARYLPASDTAEIGGDWYDVLPLPDGTTGVAIGDVMGHDIDVAALPGRPRREPSAGHRRRNRSTRRRLRRRRRFPVRRRSRRSHLDTAGHSDHDDDQCLLIVRVD